MLGYAAATRFLRTTSFEERSEIQALAAAARKINSDLDLERATMIANQVGKLFGGS